MEHISNNMGERIREMRKSKSLTQEALAQAVGVSIQAVSKWETGQSLPDVTLLPAIADYFDISMDALFGRAPAESAGSVSEEQPVQKEADSPLFPDDGRLRVVQYLGSQMLSAEESAGDRAIRVEFGRLPSGQSAKIDVEIQGSARIAGPVNGALNVAKDAYIDGDINGAANVQGDLTCKGSVNGSVRSGGSFTSRGTTTTTTIHADSMAGLKSSLNGLGSMFSGMFSGKKSGGAKMQAFFSGELPDDDVIRVVQLQGKRIMSVEESSGKQAIQLSVEHLTDPLNVEIYGSAQIEGDIRGNATAGDAMTCGNVGGSASAGDSLTCADIKGSASAGDAIRCGNIGGNANAGDGITCGTVGGSVRAGDSVQITGDVGGSVTASDSVTCGAVHGNVKADSVKYSGTRNPKKQPEQPMPDVSGYSGGALHIIQVLNGEILSAEESRKGEPICLNPEDADGISIHIHGNAQIDGGIEGDVHADGSVTCGDVEGDVIASVSVTCGTIEGDVRAGVSVTCDTIEGDVASAASVTCDMVEGDVNIQGNSDQCALSCAGIEGDLNAINASVTCNGVICGNVDLRGEKPVACSVSCDEIEGDVSAINASVSCSGVICGNVDVRGEQADRSIVICAGVEGDAAVLNASLNCRDGVISGNVDVRGEQPDKCIVICAGVEGDVTAVNASVNCQDGTIGGSVDARAEVWGPDEEE